MAACQSEVSKGLSSPHRKKMQEKALEMALPRTQFWQKHLNLLYVFKLLEILSTTTYVKGCISFVYVLWISPDYVDLGYLFTTLNHPSIGTHHNYSEVPEIQFLQIRILSGTRKEKKLGMAYEITDFAADFPSKWNKCQKSQILKSGC